MAHESAAPIPDAGGKAAAPELFTPFLRGGAAFCLLAVVVVAQSLKGKLGDPDLWWHIKTGAIINATGRIPTTDPYSYSAQGSPWTAHEWLSELLFFWMHRAWGWAGILWYRAVMLGAVVAVMFLVLRSRSRSFVVSIVLALGVALGTSSFWSERPHLFTYLFFSLLLGILDAAARGRTRLLWIIPPLILLWANLHGGFFAAYILMGSVWLGAVLDARLGTDPEAQPSRLIRPLFIVGLAAVAAACLNPQGPALLLYPLRYVTEKGIATYVSEWQVVNVKEPLGRVFEVLLLSVLALGVGTRLRCRWRDALPFLVFAHLALSAVRHVPLFALVAANLLAGVWPAVARTVSEAAARFEPFRRLMESLEIDRTTGNAGVETTGTRAVGVLLALAGVAYCAAMTPRRTDFRSLVNMKDVPVAAGTWLQQNARPGRLFNYYDYGGYLIYLPRSGDGLNGEPSPWKVVIDGREDVYGGERMREYFEHATNAGPRWQELLDHKYRADLVVWPQRLPLTRVLENRPLEWEKVYPPPGSADKQVCIFRRRGAAP